LDKTLVRAYLLYLEFQCECVLHAYDDLQLAPRASAAKQRDYREKSGELVRLTVEAEQRGDLSAAADFRRQELRLMSEYFKSDPAGPSDASRGWFCVQNLLVAAANVWKLLWGSDKKKEIARQPLRDLLRVPDTSPLYHERMRNDWEHLDDRIDTWWRQSDTHSIFEGFGWEPDAATAPIDRFRRYDPSTDRVSFRDKELDMRAVVEAVQELLPRIRAELYRI
jgi:hypothetical protein